MGPEKAYLVQHTDNTRIFWADRHQLILGACFKGKTAAVPKELLAGVRHEQQSTSLSSTPAVDDCIPDMKLLQDRFDRTVEQGYQATLTWHQGFLYIASAFPVGFCLHLHSFALRTRI